MDECDLQEYINNYMLFYISHRIGKKVMQDALMCLVYNFGVAGTNTFQDFEKLWEEQHCKSGEEPVWKTSTDESWKTKTIDYLWDDWNLEGDIIHLYFYISKYFKESKIINEIKALKDYRNKVCHADLPVHNAAFNRELQVVTGIFMRIYRGIESLSSGFQVDKDTQLRMSNIQDQVNEVIESLDLTEFKGRFDKDVSNLLIMEGRQELKKNYRTCKTITPCLWMWGKEFRDFNVDRIFTPLNLANRYITHVKTLLQVFPKSEGKSQPLVIILVGPSGSGKTSLCRFISKEWIKTFGKGLAKVNEKKEMDNLDDFNLVIHIELKRLLKKKIGKESPLFCCLRRYVLPHTLEKLNLDKEELVTLLQRLDILFIIDGFDEGAENGEMILRDITKSFKGSKIILTTTPEYQKEMEETVKEQGCRYLLGRVCFNYDSFKQFSEKVFSVLEPDDVSKRNEELAAFLSVMKTKVQGLDQCLKLPLTISKLIALWWYTPEARPRLKTSKTVTDLYDIMFELWQEKLLEKLANGSVTCNISVGDVSKILRSLCSMAWSLLKESKVYIDSDHLMDFETKCEIKHIPAVQVMSAFLTCEPEYLEKEEAENFIFSFVHKTEIEYLAARHLVSSIVEQEKCVSYFFAGEANCSRYKTLLRYLTGLMAKTSLLEEQVQSLMSVIERVESDHGYLYSLVTESHWELRLCKVLGTCEKNLNWELDDKTVVTSLMYLAATKPQIRSISVHIEGDPHKIRGFLEALKLLSQNAFMNNPNHSKLESEYNAVDAKRYSLCYLIQLKLLFNYSYCSADSKDTDEFLEAVYPWAHLTEYWGHLGNDCGKTLRYCSRLKHMVARVNCKDTLQALSRGLKTGMCKDSLKKLHIILNIPKQTEIGDDAVLHFPGDLLITIPSSQEEDIEWIAATVFMLGRWIGCQKLELQNCNMSFGAIEKLVKAIQAEESVQKKLILHLCEDLEEHEESRLERNFPKKRVGFEIELF
ncbi:uncharacterized protein LOC143031424 [Oratosquilla oratoria]|uniref:uncharacterized protein LOC143031424 n=1 Tax=Oratosquilla oratoria TaxID=337810 RepID=UPI003F760037